MMGRKGKRGDFIVDTSDCVARTGIGHFSLGALSEPNSA